MKKISLYIHIPFCKSKCLYCDFPSFALKENLINDYVDALIKEINKKTKGYIISTLFIGGGTPSYLDKNNLKKLLYCLKNLDYEIGAEKTMECNPGTLDKEKLKIIKDSGINRLSFGLQSTNNSILKSIGRIHTFEEFCENYSKARDIGFDNINIDMMFGLPNQSVSDYIDSLNKVILLNPEHISAYSLIIEEGTCFYKIYNEGRLNIPSEDEERNMYHQGKKVLESFGYYQYEISNFAKAKKECKHNIVYWKCNEYLGLGAYSSSFINGVRTKNISDISKYIYYVNSDKATSIVENINTVEDNMEEFMFMGLRMIEGISKNEFRLRFNRDIYSVYSKQIELNVRKNLLIDEDKFVRLTNKGIELSNEVMSDFII